MLQTDARIAIARLNMSDCLVTPGGADMFVQCLSSYAKMTPEQGAQAQADTRAQVERVYGVQPATGSDSKPFIFNDGMAIIPVHGVLLNRFGGCWGFVTGYNFIRAQLNAALADDDVTLIVFDVNSPGGDKAGCFELTEEIRASRDVKPSIAVVDDLAASGGYAIPAAASRMVATPSSQVGSIGVYRLHVDVSGANEQMGLKYTFVFAGEHKVDGNPFEELPDNVREDMQISVNESWDEFVADVVASRGLEEIVVRDTQARVYRAKDALALGLIDDVSTPAEAVSAFVAELAADVPEDENEEDSMALPKTEAEMTAALDAARNEGVTSVKVPDAAQIAAHAVKADRERSAAILALDEAKEKQGLAATVAGQGLTVDQAKVILAAAPVEKAVAVVETPKTPGAFVNSMDKAGGAGVTADDTPGGEQDDKPKVANFAAYLPADRRIKS